jgi:hypothetical protein
MKKFGKFIFGTAILASIAAGAYYIYKNFIKKDSTDDFDDFEDDFEDFDTEDDSEDDSESDSREYVPINITGGEKAADKADEDDSDNDEAKILPEDEE